MNKRQREDESNDAWDCFLKARLRLLRAWRAEGKSSAEMAHYASLDSPEHVELILIRTDEFDRLHASPK